MGARQDTWLPFEDEDEEEGEDARLDAPRLRKSLQRGILKLIHEIERLQANAAGEKNTPFTSWTPTPVDVSSLTRRLWRIADGSECVPRTAKSGQIRPKTDTSLEL